jgi:AcrR family transcriptional regulator
MKQEKHDIKKLIKETTTAIFKQEGFDKITMRNIALKINYSPTTIYLYYKNKEELLHDILRDYNSEYETKLARIMCKTLEPREKLLEVMKLYVMHGIEHPEMFKLLSLVFLTSSHPQRTSTPNAGYTILKGLVESCMESGYFAPNDPNLVTQSIWMQIYGVASLLIFRPAFNWADSEEITDFTLYRIIKSLKRSQ